MEKYVTKEEFEGYKQLHKKKKELEELKSEKKEYNHGGFFFGGATGVYGLITYVSLAHPNSFFSFGRTGIILGGIMSAFMAFAFYSSLKGASQDSKKAKGLEKEITELEKIK